MSPPTRVYLHQAAPHHPEFFPVDVGTELETVLTKLSRKFSTVNGAPALGPRASALVVRR